MAVSRGRFNVLVLGACFFLCFFSFNTTQNFATTLNGTLGSLSLSLLYLCFSASNLFSAVVVHHLGARLALVLGGAAYTVFIAANIYVTPVLLMPASVVIGVGAAILWTAQGVVLAKSSTEATIGANSGIFWAMFQTNGVFGNLFAAVLINGGIDTYILFACLTVSAGLATAGFLLLRPLAHGEETVDAEAVLASAEKQRLVEEDGDGDRAPVLLPDSLPGEEVAPPPPKIDPLATVALFKDVRMQLLVLLIVYSGLSQSFFFGAYPPVYGEKLLGWVMCVFALFDAAASMAAGRLSDAVGRRAVFYGTLALHFAGAFAAWAGYVWGPHHPWVFFVVAPLLGTADAGLNTQLYATVGAGFSKDPDSAFAFLKLIQSTATSAAFFYTPYLNVMVVLSIMMLFLVPGSLLLFLMDRMVVPLNPPPPHHASAPDDASSPTPVQ